MQGRKKAVRELVVDPEVEKTAKANRKAVWLAREDARLASVCGYTYPPGISESDKRLRLFKLSLTGRAKDWIDTLPSNTITTWDELELKFLERYFPIHKYLERRNDITNFEQGDSESLYDAWERFKLCLKKFPKHGIDNHAQMQHFTQGLRAHTRMLFDASVGGSLKNKDESEARELVEAMAQNEHRLMNTQMAAMLKHFMTTPTPQMKANAVQDVKCTLCGQGHANGECFPTGSEEAMYLSNFKKSNPNNNPYSNTYNSEQALAQFIKVPQGNFEEMKISQNQMKVTQYQMKASQDVANKNHEASIKTLETQIGQLSRQFAATQNNDFEGSTKDNPRNEICMDINLRSRVVPSPEDREKNIESDEKLVAKKKEALEQMPVYAKFMKELLTKKRKPLDDDTVNMTEECSEIIQKKLPQKKKNPGSFTIPCYIVNLHVRRTLCDLGASINLMPLSVMNRIPGAVAKPTKMKLSLADRSIMYPHGILQDVLVRCAEFVFPTDFVIPDMEEDAEVFEATKFSGIVPECFKVDVLEEVPNPPGLQELPPNGKHVLLGEDSKQPVIISSLLTPLEEDDFVKELEKDHEALVWGSDSIISAFCLHKMNKEEEVNSGVDAYKSSVLPLEGLKSLLNRGETNLKYPP
ncbi:hypothetical protein TSUD_364530 [Trifolium subterraneum]|uniref:Retrotransposon gag domain-containing protein n=1 Tax=Trifolium subterraneum TaxID=3900 RepID=A0A2Z6NKT1_TRISU|nr:hypothetical protein TSUD_364530 [Trifolium subterraneum]